MAPFEKVQWLYQHTLHLQPLSSSEILLGQNRERNWGLGVVYSDVQN